MAEYDGSVGARLKRVRKTLGMTLEETAAIIGVTRQQYCKYENGSSQMSASIIRIFCDRLGCDPDWLLGVRDSLRVTVGGDVVSVESEPIPCPDRRSRANA